MAQGCGPEIPSVERRRQEDHPKFEANLVCTVGFRTVKAIQQDPFSKVKCKITIKSNRKEPASIGEQERVNEKHTN